MFAEVSVIAKLLELRLARLLIKVAMLPVLGIGVGVVVVLSVNPNAANCLRSI